MSMSKRVSFTKNCQQGGSEQGQGNLIAEYAIALNEKTKLETENALLKINLENQEEKFTKLLIDHEQAKNQIDKYEDVIAEMEECLEHMKERCKSEESAKKALKAQEENLKTDVNVLKQELQNAHQKLNELAMEVSKWREKGKEYKERLRHCVKILESCNFGKTLVCDKECQTRNRRRKPSPVNYLEGVPFDERILSEIFYKSNPFMDTL